MRGVFATSALLLGAAFGFVEHDVLSHHESAARVLSAYGYKGDSLQRHVFKRSIKASNENPVKSLVPDVQVFRPAYRKGAIRKKVRYGPMTLPSSKEKNWQALKLGDSGMSNTMKVKIQQPCSDCTLLFANAGLEYNDGQTANINTGSWLHHIVLMTYGPGRRDAACNYSGSDPFFASGNERSLTPFTSLDGKFKTGYYIRSTDSMSLYSELMNLDVAPKHVWVTITYEYLPGIPKDYLSTRAVWLGLGQCLKPPYSEGKAGPYPLDKQGRPLTNKPFDVNSPAWVSPWHGEKISAAGHLHDGGTNVAIYENKKIMCDSVASYGGKADFIERSTGIQGQTGMKHISRMTSCSMMGPLKKGNHYYLTARYNFDKHPSMLNNKGQLDEIMGISLMYISVPHGAI